MSKIIITIEIPDGATVGTTTTTGTQREAVSEAKAAVADSQADPWGSHESSAGTRSGPSHAPEQSNVQVVETKSGNQTWTFHAPNAPVCGCDQPAAHVEGVGKNGKAWKAWRCSKGSGQNWRDKCDFSEWA